MSDRGTEALDAERAVEAKLAEAGADTIRRHSFDEAPEVPVEAPAVAETVTEPEPARNELGQFVSTEEEPVEEVVSDADPAVAAFLNKYGGDVDKALAGAVHLQRKAGEQTNELGDLRRMVDELSRLSDNIQSQNQPQTQYVDQATVDWYDEQVMANPQQALEWARQQGNQMLVTRGLSVWKDVDPYEAAVYTNALQNQAWQAQVQQQLAQQARMPQDTAVNLALQNVRNRNPQLVSYDGDLGTTLEKHPFAARALEQAANSGDPAQIEGAIETLYSLAEGDTLRTIALHPGTNGETVTTQDVATPTVSETRDPAPEPTALDRFREQFRQESDRARKGVWVAE